MIKIKIVGIALSLLTLSATVISCRAQDAPALKTTGQIAATAYPLGQNGLYFGDKKEVDYIFGPRITPHGDCITAIPGYVFVSWYRGPRSDRHLMISRLNLKTANWKHVELPEVNTLGRINSVKRAEENLGAADVRGESHRTAAVGVCPIDGTIHLIFG